VTEDELSALEALCSKATAGPWVWTYEGELLSASTDRQVIEAGCDCGSDIGSGSGSLECGGADSSFIVAARTALPALLADQRRLIEALRQITKVTQNSRAWLIADNALHAALSPPDGSTAAGQASGSAHSDALPPPPWKRRFTARARYKVKRFTPPIFTKEQNDGEGQ
jgi:hypothetical protein